MELAVAIVLLAALATSSQASSRVEGRPPFPLPIHLLRPLSGAGGHPLSGVSCVSWRVGVEANNVREWETIPSTCEGYVGHYMLGDLYRQDSALVTAEAAKYAEGLDLQGNGKNVWVFDVDETTLSNLPYYAHHGFGVEPYNSTSFNAWVMEGEAPALPESLELYEKLLSLGIKIVFLTGRTEDQRNVTAQNLKTVGYHTWEKLILKGLNVSGSSVAYKSGMRQKLEDEGYRIVGNMGDQWSDILGQPEGNRTFKFPDPMFEPYNATSFTAWVMKGKAPVLPESLKLYKKLLFLGIRIAILTGRSKDQGNITAHELKMAGYPTWKKLILKTGLNVSGSSVGYKSGMGQKLEEEGYIELLETWESEILGEPMGDRTSKFPDPMYYIS